MFDDARAHLRAVLSRSRRFERREVHDFRRWIESSRNLIHLSVLLFVPVLVGLVTLISNVAHLSFLLFPPLAAGAYLLFAHPEERYAAPWRFVSGLTAGAACGWIAVAITSQLYYGTSAAREIHAGGAALAMFLTGAATWAFDIVAAASSYTDLVMLGASTDRSAVSRLLAPATFERLHDIECDVAIVDRRYQPLDHE